ncbi:flagellar basal-body MS-ring/collar protein FliF [Erythrobacter sp. W53]|uniref:flagellar basal-body MS-ring/collar protein FliF n=1 Tax=Erythrobacter sp. W53 TaxID=3425947 RepID=UPI003D767B38
MQLDTRQLRTILLILGVVVTILAILWFAFLRTTYTPAYQNIREADASAIIAELDDAGIPYRLANEGHDILVPEDQAADARVAVAGSNVSMGGTVGFELFNDSDMGLTEFAQKINFQRAMQGELSRTIMMMDGIEFARVHLAIPERSVFRSAQGTPTAAVTIEMVPGFPLTPQRIGGVRQLVASSVPGLSTLDVAVLDENGDLVSASAVSTLEAGASASSEQGVLENLYRIKASKAIESALPGLQFELEVAARPAQARPTPPSTASEDEGESADAPAPQAELRSSPDREATALRVQVRTPQSLSREERDQIQTSLVDGLDLAEGRGDVLTFTTGALTGALPIEQTAQTSTTQSSVPNAPQASGSWGLTDSMFEMLLSRWTIIMFVLLGIVAFVVWPRRRLADEEAASFAEMLKSAAGDRREISRG